MLFSRSRKIELNNFPKVFLESIEDSTLIKLSRCFFFFFDFWGVVVTRFRSMLFVAYIYINVNIYLCCLLEGKKFSDFILQNLISFFLRWQPWFRYFLKPKFNYFECSEVCFFFNPSRVSCHGNSTTKIHCNIFYLRFFFLVFVTKSKKII